MAGSLIPVLGGGMRGNTLSWRFLQSARILRLGRPLRLGFEPGASRDFFGFRHIVYTVATLMFFSQASDLRV